MPPDLWAALSRRPLYLDQTGLALELDREELERFYHPLAERILPRAASGRQVVVVAGPPGSGKSAFAAVLAAALNALAGEHLAVVIGQDGWHYSNAELERRWIERGGQRVRLRTVKGAPESFDRQRIAAFVAALKKTPELSFPVYSRETHDPVEGAGQVESRHRIVVLEGNYWLLDEPPWNQLQPHYDLRIFLTASPDALAAGLLERHLRGGRPAQAAEVHVRQVDLPNIERVLARSLPADVLVRKAGSRRIAGLEFNPAGGHLGG